MIVEQLRSGNEVQQLAAVVAAAGGAELKVEPFHVLRARLDEWLLSPLEAGDMKASAEAELRTALGLANG